MALLRNVTEGLARRTSRRGLLGNGLRLSFGALAGVAAGKAATARRAVAGGGTVCIFPRQPCPCEACTSAGVCAKPCIIATYAYASGCWVTDSVTCCDCECQDFEGVGPCGCGTDYHNDPAFCPDGNASG